MFMHSIAAQVRWFFINCDSSTTTLFFVVALKKGAILEKTDEHVLAFHEARQIVN